MPTPPTEPTHQGSTTHNPTASPLRPPLRPKGVHGQTRASASPRPPIFDGDALSEPATTASAQCVPTNRIRPLVTHRTASFWTAVHDLLSDGHWHDRDELQQLATDHNLANRTAANLLPRAAARQWITRRGALIKIRDRDALRAELEQVAR